MTGSVYAIPSADPEGPHTLVADLAPSPPATFSSSIFNNPDRDSISAPSTPRQPTTPRRFQLDNGSKIGSSSAVKEVDDPTSTPSNDKSNTPGRTLAAPLPHNTFGLNGRCNSFRGTFPRPEKALGFANLARL